MKTTRITFVNVFFLILLIGCGPSKEEIETDNKKLIDSVAKATELGLLQKRTQDSLANIKVEQLKMDSAVSALNEAFEDLSNNETCKELRAKLSVAEDKLYEIKQWKLGRTADEKEAQLESQYKLIEDLKDQLKNCE